MNNFIFVIITKIVSFFIVRERFSILTYHRVLDNDAANYTGDVTIEQFDMQMKILSKYFNVVHLENAVSDLGSGCLKKRTICITFDDGYKDNLINAAPILKKYSIPAIIFVASGYRNGNCMWNDIIIEAIKGARKKELMLESYGLDNFRWESDTDRINAVHKLLEKIKYLNKDEREKYARIVNKECGTELVSNLMMNDAELLELEKFNLKIGGHTVTHPILSKLSLQRATEEIVGGKDDLTKTINCEINAFAYPNGRKDVDYTDEQIGIVKQAGFNMAVSTNPGFVDKNSDSYQLPRLVPWHKTEIKFFLFLLKLFIIKK